MIKNLGNGSDICLKLEEELDGWVIGGYIDVSIGVTEKITQEEALIIEKAAKILGRIKDFPDP
jgi:hypothetical protein